LMMPNRNQLFWSTERILMPWSCLIVLAGWLNASKRDFHLTPI